MGSHRDLEQAVIEAQLFARSMFDRCEVAFWHFSHLNELKVLAFVEHLTDPQFFALEFLV